jgi:hypothetical protein
MPFHKILFIGACAITAWALFVAIAYGISIISYDLGAYFCN